MGRRALVAEASGRVVYDVKESTGSMERLESGIVDAAAASDARKGALSTAICTDERSQRSGPDALDCG